MSLLEVANEANFAQTAVSSSLLSRLMQKILNSCLDTSRVGSTRQGVDQSWMQDPIPPVLFNLVDLALTPGHGRAKGASG